MTTELAIVPVKKFYRYERGWGKDLHVQEFNLVKETPKGWWIIEDFFGSGTPEEERMEYARWVSKTARKRYAYPTLHEAAIGFYYRKLCHIKILRAQQLGAEEQLEAIKFILKESTNDDDTERSKETGR